MTLTTVWVLDPDGRWHEEQWNPSRYRYCYECSLRHDEPVYHLF